ncbi:hypothetical protein [Streptococcus sp. 121]|nr:hypothetical protein [Streptococcus sp. 121]
MELLFYGILIGLLVVVLIGHFVIIAVDREFKEREDKDDKGNPPS